VTSRWLPTPRLQLLDQLAARSGSDSEGFFDAYGLGSAYRKPGNASSKKTKINAALHAAELRGDVDEVLDAIQHYLLPRATVQPSGASNLESERAMPIPSTPAQTQVLQTIWDIFFQSSAWPTFTEVDRQLDQHYDIDIVQATESMPGDLMQPPKPNAWQKDEPLRLTIAGAAACNGSAEDLGIFLAAVRLAARIQREFIGSPGDEDPSLTPADLRRCILLPAAGRDRTLARVGQLLLVERWGWSAGGSGRVKEDWHFTIGRDVRRLRGVSSLQEYWLASRSGNAPTITVSEEALVATKPVTIFLVHGHDEARHEVARFLESLTRGAEVITLAEQASRGKTVIEKFEEHGSAASFAVVLLTPDDEGRSLKADELLPRARQNVVLELGFFIGKLGRDRVLVLNKGPVEQPSDMAGIMYINYPDGNWKLDLARELKAAGFIVDPLQS
jgi:hypothetical protein